MKTHIMEGHLWKHTQANFNMHTETKRRQLFIHLPPQCWSLSKPDAGRMTAERRGTQGQTHTHIHTHAWSHTHARAHTLPGETASRTQQSRTNIRGVDTCRNKNSEWEIDMLFKILSTQSIEGFFPLSQWITKLSREKWTVEWKNSSTPSDWT